MKTRKIRNMNVNSDLIIRGVEKLAWLCLIWPGIDEHPHKTQRQQQQFSIFLKSIFINFTLYKIQTEVKVIGKWGEEEKGGRNKK